MVLPMKSGVTIAGARVGHNCPQVCLGPCPVPRAVKGAGWVSVLGVAILGCAAASPPPAEIPVWQLAHAEPVKPRVLGRARVSPDRPLPEHLIQPLCEEFALVIITRPADWADVRRRLRLDRAPLDVDLSQGMIVGILANVGECPRDTWPIQLQTVRTYSGEGWVEARFCAGFYYPLVTAGYLELAYVPGLRTVRMVHIANRTFMIRSTTPSH